MGRLDAIRRRIRGRTISEWKTNVEDEVWESPRGNGASAKNGKDGIAREQLMAKMLGDEGYDRTQAVETHSGESLVTQPRTRREILRILLFGGAAAGAVYALERLPSGPGAPGAG